MALDDRTRDSVVADILARRVEEDPDDAFLLYRDQVLTYRQVAEQARSLAAALANLGIEPGDRVAILLPKCPEFVIGLFAVARLGAIAVPLDPQLTSSELRYMLRHSQAACAITVESLNGVDYLQLFEDLLPGLPELQYLVTVGEEDLWYDDRIFQFEDLVSAGRGRALENDPARDPSDLFAIVYTSGTTGKPKGVELTHRNLLHAAGATASRLGLEPSDRVIGVTALFHVFGLGPGILGTALSGAALVLQEEFEPGSILDLIEHHRVTVHYGVPTVFVRELHEQRQAPRDLSSLRIGLAAGAPLGEKLFDAPDETTFAYLKGRPHAPSGPDWDAALEYWRDLRTDGGAVYDRTVKLDAGTFTPTVTWGTTPAMSVPVDGRVPEPDDTRDPEQARRALEYMGLSGGEAITDLRLDRVFLGSCTNARIEDLRAAAAVVEGKRVADSVRAMVVPGSYPVKLQAEAEGLDEVFTGAGFEWREPGCSMCLGMNPDILEPGERCASTSNRNFEGRQGRGGRTHLVSPAMAAAAAIHGHFVDVRELA